MQDPNRYDVIIAGGGLAGLSAAIQLAEKRYRVALIEKIITLFTVFAVNISEESRPFLERIGILLVPCLYLKFDGFV